jgi:hypothetical protein
LNPSKWPLRILSPMGDGALRGFAISLIVADRRGLFLNGAVLSVGLTAVFGGGVGRPLVSIVGFTKAELLRESLRRRLVPRSFFGSGYVGAGFWEKRLATVALARRACAATGISASVSSSSKRGGGPNLRLNGNVAAVVAGVLVGDDWARK